jgi:lantibiotic transport system permease protein
MLIRTIRAEQMKLKHSPVWLAFLILPLLAAVMGTFNYVQNIEILESEWFSLWSQHTLFSCYFFLPALIGVYCSYLCRLEHIEHNWNATLTVPVRISAIYFAKLFSASLMIIFTQCWVGVLFILSGKLVGLASPIPSDLPIWLACGAIGGIVICALQLCFSLVFHSFAVPVGLSVIGGIAGLAALAKGDAVWFPYSILSMGMRANNPSQEMQASMSQFLLNSLIFLILFSLFAVLWLKKRDVVTA